MKTPVSADLMRWTEEVARDPASLAFLPLARAYRRMGRREAALQLCVRGLEHYPQHAEAHALLALLHLERGDRQRAADEWSVVLRLDGNNFEALRGLGFAFLEQDQLSKARQMLERAALLRPGDAAVDEALRLLGDRQDVRRPYAPDEYHASPSARGWAFADLESAASSSPAQAAPAAGGRTADHEPHEAGATSAGGGPASSADAAPPRRDSAPEEMSWREVLARADRPTPPRERPGRSGRGAAYQDPDTLFDAVTGRGPIVGVLLLDASGLVLAGRLEGERRAEALGALIGAVAREGIRVARHLALGKWSGLLLDTEGLLLHVAPAGDGAALLVAARADAPIGWVLRAAGHAAEIAQRYVEADHE